MHLLAGRDGRTVNSDELPVNPLMRECENMHVYRTRLHGNTVTSRKAFKRLDAVFLVLCRSGEVKVFFVRISKRATCLISCTCLVEREIDRQSFLSLST